MFASYYTPGNPIRPNDAYVDSMLITAMINSTVQLLIIAPLGIYLKLSSKRVFFKCLMFFNLSLAAVFASFLIAELWLYCGYFYWCRFNF